MLNSKKFLINSHLRSREKLISHKLDFFEHKTWEKTSMNFIQNPEGID